MLKPNFIALTGGPGGGKSTLLKSLKERGFQIVDETARQVIKERLQKGLTPRPEPDVFARALFEKDFRNFIDNLNSTDLIFFDRSLVDSAGMIQSSDKEYFENIKSILHSHRFNNKVFITPPWQEIYRQDEERDQTFEEAIDVYKRLYNWYEWSGYNLIPLPKTSVDNRVEFILRELEIDNSKF